MMSSLSEYAQIQSIERAHRIIPNALFFHSSTKEEVAQVGTISANGEREIGDLLSEAMERVGKEGVITVQDGKTLYNELDVVEGMKFDRGYISPYFITDNKAQIVEFEKPLILLVEKRISNLASLIPLLESVVKSQRPLLIIAEVCSLLIILTFCFAFTVRNTKLKYDGCHIIRFESVTVSATTRIPPRHSICHGVYFHKMVPV